MAGRSGEQFGADVRFGIAHGPVEGGHVVATNPVATQTSESCLHDAHSFQVSEIVSFLGDCQSAVAARIHA